jgi:glutamine amidotransferase
VCRHIAYLGQPRSLHDLLFAPDFGLDRQAWQPRRQRFGTINVDGFGVGWWAGDPYRPVRYRRDTPIWNDDTITDLARVTSSTSVVAAVRSATPGSAAGVEAAAPFGDGHRLFSHNGRIEKWPDGVADLVRDLPPGSLLNLVARTDSALLWLLIQHSLADGLTLEAAVAAVVLRAAEASPGRYNLLLHDGEQLVATAFGDSLFVCRGTAGVTVASEPTTDEPAWEEVADESIVVVKEGAVDIGPIGAVLS